MGNKYSVVQYQYHKASCQQMLRNQQKSFFFQEATTEDQTNFLMLREKCLAN